MTTMRWQFDKSGEINKAMIPSDARVIFFGWQEARKAFSVWTVSEVEDLHPRSFVFKGTGSAVPEFSDHVGSCVMPDGFHVYHAFEVNYE